MTTLPSDRFESADAVWHIVAQELQARNHRDCPAFNLPDELASTVFGFLTIRDVVRCTFVCKDWSRLTVSTPRLWTRLTIRAQDKVRASKIQQYVEQLQHSNCPQWMNRSAQLAALLGRSEPLALNLIFVMPWAGTKGHQSLIQVVSSCIASRTLVSLELHFRPEYGSEWAASLLRASAPHLQDLSLSVNENGLTQDLAIVPNRSFSDSHPASLNLHHVHPRGLGCGPATTISECFTLLTHLSLRTQVNCVDLGKALEQVFSSCHCLSDLTILWIADRIPGHFLEGLASPPASSALKRLRVVIPYEHTRLPNFIQIMRRNLPHLSVCIRVNDWDRCRANDVFFCEDARTVRLTAVFTDPAIPDPFRFQHSPPAPGVPAYASVTFHNETCWGETFYLRTVDGGVRTTQGYILKKLRIMNTRPVERLVGLVVITIAEAFWDALARSVGSMPFLKNLDILVASRQPGIYWVQDYTHRGVQPMVFNERMAMPDGLPEEGTMGFHERSPYRCTCLSLETLRLAQDPHFATGEHAVKVEAWQIARFIGHQLGWEAYGTVSNELPLQLVLQRVELGGRDLADERQLILNGIIIKESYATFVHQDVETRWDRPCYPKPDSWV